MSESAAQDDLSKPATKPSPKMKSLCARLAAVQAIYQNSQNKQPIKDLINEYLVYRSDMIIDGEAMSKPDGVLLKNILLGVDARKNDLTPIVKEHLKKGDEQRRIEPLMMAILMCASYELMVQDVDAPIIINDYLNIGHNYYGPKEVGLMNAILDKIAGVFKI